MRRTGSRALDFARTAIVLAIVAPPSVALGANDSTVPVRLEWSAPSGCPSRDEMVDRIARIVGTAAAPEPMAARATVREAPNASFAADVTMTSASATNARHFEGSSCAAVADAVALVIALAVNPSAIAGAREPPAPIAPAPASPVPETPAAPASSPPPSPARRAIAIGASVLVDASTLPSAGIGAELYAGWHPPRAALEATFAYVASESATLASKPNEGADFALVHLGVRGCYDVWGARIAVGPCAGAGFEWIDARGFGAAQPSNATGHMALASIGLRAMAHLTPWLALRLGADGIAPFARPTFVIDNGGQVFHVAALLFRASFGAELHF